MNKLTRIYVVLCTMVNGAFYIASLMYFSGDFEGVLSFSEAVTIWVLVLLPSLSAFLLFVGGWLRFFRKAKTSSIAFGLFLCLLTPLLVGTYVYQRHRNISDGCFATSGMPCPPTNLH